MTRPLNWGADYSALLLSQFNATHGTQITMTDQFDEIEREIQRALVTFMQINGRNVSPYLLLPKRELANVKRNRDHLRLVVSNQPSFHTPNRVLSEEDFTATFGPGDF